jgi:hypothetical protein
MKLRCCCCCNCCIAAIAVAESLLLLLLLAYYCYHLFCDVSQKVVWSRILLRHAPRVLRRSLKDLKALVQVLIKL